MLSHEFNESFDRNMPQSTNPPRWIERLANLISEEFRSSDLLAPIGCHFHHHDDGVDRPQWEVTLFVSNTEFFGGPHDGKLAVARYMLDLKKVFAVFESVDSFYWQAQSMADDDQIGPHIGLEGEFEGHSVWLRVTSEPPTQFGAGRSVDLYSNVVEDCW